MVLGLLLVQSLCASGLAWFMSARPLLLSVDFHELFSWIKEVLNTEKIGLTEVDERLRGERKKRIWCAPAWRACVRVCACVRACDLYHHQSISGDHAAIVFMSVRPFLLVDSVS